MFKYGRKSGLMSVALIVLSVIPIVTAIFFLPQMPEAVPIKFNAAGEAVRWSSHIEMMIAPGLTLLLGLASYVTAGRQARSHEGESDAMARLTAERFLRNGLVTAVVLNLANAYIFYTALTGHSIF
ncbi:MAG: DUF1648 domain-containing protein [Collinsella sp.]|nr:DUF1648 domain-containing protein [Collinsella sp.]